MAFGEGGWFVVENFTSIGIEKTKRGCSSVGRAPSLLSDEVVGSIPTSSTKSKDRQGQLGLAGFRRKSRKR